MPIHNPTSHRLDEIAVWNCIEVFGQIGVDYIRVTPADMPVHLLDCLLDVAARHQDHAFEAAEIGLAIGSNVVVVRPI